MAEKAKAPELPRQLQWVNTDKPPDIAKCRGKVVLIYFWTPSNFNSRALLLDIRALENRHENGVVVIGIVCPKYPRECTPASIQKAINRHFIRHPVALDSDFTLWQQYGVRSWPSAAVIDAEGQLRLLTEGDDAGEALDEAVDALLDEAASKDIRDYTQLAAARRSEPAGLLKFPTAILPARGHVYISDSGNNRILEVSEKGRLIRVFGSGNPGFWDGALDNSGFNFPQGLSVTENYLYVADTGNHAIRRINLFTGEVETVMGTGKAAKTMTLAETNLREIGCNSPVGLASKGPDLYISMAGSHQLWRLDLKNSQVSWHSGSGQLGLINGERAKAAFACPMGLTVHGDVLLVADADSSAVREVNIKTGDISTRTGRGTYTFGCEDGGRANALMQFPCDVALSLNREQLWIADTYNSRIRLLDLASNRLTTPAIDYEFSEPTYLTVYDHALWVADSNAHQILQVHLADRSVKPFDVVETSL
ncbi:MAG: thioredoxin-like domain-containing protein [Pseudomonadota bacterium]